MSPSKASIWRPFTQMKTAPLAQKVVRSEGAHLFLDNGKKIIDGISSWWVITHGHCQPEIIEAINRQSQKLDQVLFANFVHESAERLTELIGKILPAKLKHIFFTDNGSTAVESALKMAFQANRQSQSRPKDLFLAFKNSYHGDTVGAMSVGGPSPYTDAYGEMLFKVIHCDQGQVSTDSVETYTQDCCEKIEKYSDRLIGLIVEPLIQGAGGMIVWPQEALNKICQKAHEHGLYIIFDEVMTGFGRTGSQFAFEQLEVIPDILCLSKGLTGGSLPLALTVASDQIYSCFYSDKKSKLFFHGHSFTGNPISCAAASANIELILKTDQKKIWQGMTETYISELSEMKDFTNVKDLRIKGTMAALEFKTDQEGYASEALIGLQQDLFEKGLFVRPLGNTLYLLPPYSISLEELKVSCQWIKELSQKF